MRNQPTKRKLTREQRAGFRKRLDVETWNMVQALGGRRTRASDHFGTMYPYLVPTVLGDLLLHPHSMSIMGRFVEVERAIARLDCDQLNLYSGKWNHYAHWGATGAETWKNVSALVPLIAGYIQSFGPNPLGNTAPSEYERSAFGEHWCANPAYVPLYNERVLVAEYPGAHTVPAVRVYRQAVGVAFYSIEVVGAVVRIDCGSGESQLAAQIAQALSEDQLQLVLQPTNSN